ncbi:MAG: hypothetical protein J0647_05560 [Campylobacteraceae bacterium]|nr:hypothetical protein [Campylobacteraceae bacterium]
MSQEIFCGERKELREKLSQVNYSTLNGALIGGFGGAAAFAAGNAAVGLQNIGAGAGIGFVFGAIQMGIDKYKEDHEYIMVREYTNDKEEKTLLISLLIVDNGMSAEEVKETLEKEQLSKIEKGTL